MQSEKIPASDETSVIRVLLLLLDVAAHGRLAVIEYPAEIVLAAIELIPTWKWIDWKALSNA